MSIKFNKTILSFFFYLAVLGALTACGGGGGGGGGGDNTTESSCNSETHLCSGNQIVTGQACTDHIAIPTNNIYDCDTGERTCDNSELFCHSTETSREDCVLFSHECDGPVVGDKQGTGEERQTFNVDNAKDTIDMADGTGTGYRPSEYEVPPGYTDGDDVAADYWTPALELIRGTSTEPNTEYHRGGGAEKIGAAYAYARDATGQDVIISQVGRVIYKNNPELPSSQFIDGYRALKKLGDRYQMLLREKFAKHGDGAGLCTAKGASCGSESHPYAAGIMVASRGIDIDADMAGKLLGIQGIAYNAKLKPIDILDDGADPVEGELSARRRFKKPLRGIGKIVMNQRMIKRLPLATRSQ